MTAAELQSMARDPAAFRAALVIRCAHGLKRFGDVIAPFQETDFRAMDPAFVALAQGRKPERGRFWLERTKGGSKDSDLAVMMLWLLAFSGRPVRIQIGAYDSDQADEVRLIIQDILRIDAPLNRLLADVTKTIRGEIRNARTDSVCEILTTDSRGSHGSRPDLCLVNELSHIGNQEFAETLLDNADKVPNGVVCIATNAGALDTWQFAWHELARTSPRWYFSALTEPAPWIDPADLEESRRRNSASRFNRLWRGHWVRGSGDALDLDDIEAAITLRAPMEEARPGYAFVSGLDLATRRDFASVVTVAADYENRRVRLAHCQSWKPMPGGTIDLTGVEEAVYEAAWTFRCPVYFDPFQAVAMAQRLTRLGLTMHEVPFVGANLNRMASAMLQVFRERRIDLYDDRELIRDLGRLTIVERSFGYKLEANRDPNGGHADRAFALALALPAAMEIAQTLTPCNVQEGLVGYLC